MFYIDEQRTKKEYYSTYALTVCGLLWETHTHVFQQVFCNKMYQPIKCLVSLENPDRIDHVIWGKGYTEVEYNPLDETELMLLIE